MFNRLRDYDFVDADTGLASGFYKEMILSGTQLGRSPSFNNLEMFYFLPSICVLGGKNHPTR